MRAPIIILLVFMMGGHTRSSASTNDIYDIEVGFADVNISEDFDLDSFRQAFETALQQTSLFSMVYIPSASVLEIEHEEIVNSSGTGRAVVCYVIYSGNQSVIEETFSTGFAVQYDDEVYTSYATKITPAVFINLDFDSLDQLELREAVNVSLVDLGVNPSCIFNITFQAGSVIAEIYSIDVDGQANVGDIVNNGQLTILYDNEMYTGIRWYSTLPTTSTTTKSTTVSSTISTIHTTRMPAPDVPFSGKGVPLTTTKLIISACAAGVVAAFIFFVLLVAHIRACCCRRKELQTIAMATAVPRDLMLPRTQRYGSFSKSTPLKKYESTAMIVLDTPGRHSFEQPSSDTKSTSSWRSQQTLSPDQLTETLLDDVSTTEPEPFRESDFLTAEELSVKDLKII